MLEVMSLVTFNAHDAQFGTAIVAVELDLLLWVVHTLLVRAGVSGFYHLI